MELQKYNNQENQISKALTSPIVRKVEENELRIVISRAIAKAFADTGQSKETTDIDYLIGTIPFEIKKQVPSIRLDEIPIAINNGIFGHYGKYYGINVLTIISFCQQYLESEERKKEGQKMLQLSEPKEIIPSQEETIKAIKEAITKAYQAFLINGNYNDHFNFIYDKLDERKLIPLLSHQKAEIFKKAKESLRKKNNPFFANGRDERKEFLRINELIDNNDSIEGNNAIKREAKKIALNEVFSIFKKDKTDILKLLENTNDHF